MDAILPEKVMSNSDAFPLTKISNKQNKVVNLKKKIFSCTGSSRNGYSCITLYFLALLLHCTSLLKKIV